MRKNPRRKRTRPRRMTYLDIGHPASSHKGKTGAIPFHMPRGKDDIVYLEPGTAHYEFEGASYHTSDIMGRVDPEKKQISIASKGPYGGKRQERVLYAAEVLAMDFPGYEIWYFPERQPSQRLKNPIAAIFDTDHPPADADRALGYAAVYDDRRRALKSWHVTNDARQIMEMVEAGMPLLEMGGEHKEFRELGPGLYMSAVPQLWVGRATKKWEFLEHLNPIQRQTLADALGKIVLEQRQTGYITESEYKRANRDLELFVDHASTGAVIQLAGQPHNISFWKPDFLKPLGIKPGAEPEIVEFTLQGYFAGLNKIPTRKEIKALIQDEFDGCFLRGGLVDIAQLVVWRNQAIVGTRKSRL